VDENGNRYYDHALTQIEKGKLLDYAARVTSTPPHQGVPDFDYKDKRLFSILQNNSSKVVDSNGEPLAVYHGTVGNSGFTVFEESKIGSANDTGIYGRGFYFTPYKEIADMYRIETGDRYNVFLNVKNPFTFEENNDEDGFRRLSETANVSQLKANVFNKNARSLGEWYKEYMKIKEEIQNGKHDDLLNSSDSEYRFFKPEDRKKELLNDLLAERGYNIVLSMKTLVNSLNSDEFSEALKRDGYDGVYKNYPHSEEYIAFYPNQIKSAASNNGAFDEQSDDIRFHSVDERDADPPEDHQPSVEAEAARQKLNQKLSRIASRVKENWQDAHLPVKEFEEKLRSMGVKINSVNDFYQNVTHLPGKNHFRMEKFRQTIGKRMLAAVDEVIKEQQKAGWTQAGRRTTNNYLMGKHGLERNEKKRRDELERFSKQEDDKGKLPDALSIARKEKALKKKDFAGVKALAWELKNSRPRAAETESQFKARKEEIKEMDISEAETTVAAFVKTFETYATAEAMEKMRENIRNATNFPLNMLVREGVITRAFAEELKNSYQAYVPLRGHDEATAEELYDYESRMGTYMSEPVKTAKGRNSLADDPLAFIYQMAQTAINTSNFNQLKLGLLRIARTQDTKGLISSSDTWMVKTGGKDASGREIWEERYPEYSEDEQTNAQNIKDFQKIMLEKEATGEARHSRAALDIGGFFIKPSQRAEHAVTVYEAGEKKTLYINANPRIARSINGDNRYLMGKTAQKVADITRWMAANATSRNPVFMIRNAIRDIEHAALWNINKEGVAYANSFKNNLPHAAAAIARMNRGRGNMQNMYDKYCYEFISNGGKTGFTAMMELERAKREIEKELKTGLNGARAKSLSVKTLLELIQTGNDMSENISRLATYITSRQEGRDVSRSIWDAKEVTLNFNRKGAGNMMAAYGRTLYMFLNANIQGLSQLGLLAKKHSKSFAVTAAALALSGLLQPLLASLQDDDDYYWKLSDYERRNNFILPSYKGFIKIPIAQGFSLFHALGDITASYLYGRENLSACVTDVFVSLVDMLPFSAEQGSLSGTLSPDFAKAIVQAEMNMDFMGRNIYNEYANENDPGYKKIKTNKKGEAYTPQWLIKLAELADSATGGFRRTGTDKSSSRQNKSFVARLFRRSFYAVFKVGGYYIQVCGRRKGHKNEGYSFP
jgi:plasmid stabilization system protein ParE